MAMRNSFSLFARLEIDIAEILASRRGRTLIWLKRPRAAAAAYRMTWVRARRPASDFAPRRDMNL